MSPPKIRIRGARTRAPAGYIIGRTNQAGGGELQFLSLRDLTGMGVATSASVVKSTPPVGFGFTIDGLPSDHQSIGTAIYSRDVTFDGTDPGTSVTALVPSTGTAVFTLTVVIGGAPTIVGTITFSAGNPAAVVAWSPPLNLLAGTPMTLWAPTPADATLANISGIVVGRLT